MGQILNRKNISEFVENLHKAGKTVATTNGCFDILHVGHVRYLQKSASFTDYLIVLLNSDKSVKSIKGDELSLYLNENPSTVIYISDRYDVSKEGLEEKLKDRIIELNLYENFIYLDKEQLTPSFIADFNKQNETSITISKLPTLIVFNDNEVEIIYYSLKEEDVKTIDFEGVR